MPLTPFNDLPPKPEYVSKVKAALQGHESLNVSDLIAKTGLTKTQVLCAVQPLIKQGLIEKKKGAGVFCRVRK